MDIITFRTFVEDRDKAIENLDVKALLKCCKEYPKSEQVARCGNAVPPPFAEALTRANLPELCGIRAEMGA